MGGGSIVARTVYHVREHLAHDHVIIDYHYLCHRKGNGRAHIPPRMPYQFSFSKDFLLPMKPYLIAAPKQL
jgi:hypothetical protein